MRMITQKQVVEEKPSIFKPNDLTEEEMKYLLEQSSKGFLMVLSADRAQILFVTDSISDWTNHTPSDLIGRSLIHLAHANDEKTIMDMLLPYPLLPSINMSDTPNNKAEDEEGGSGGDKLNSSKEMLCGITGSKRSFFFRLNSSKQMYVRADQHSKSRPLQHPVVGNTYMTVHCSGFLKSWQTTGQSLYTVDKDIELATFTCFVGVGRPIKELETKRDPPNEISPTMQYYSRHSADSKYLYADTGVVLISGYLPQDLIGKCEYDFIHEDDTKYLADTYRKVLLTKHQGKVVSKMYRFKSRLGEVIPMKTIAYSLFNPFTDELEFVMQQNLVLPGNAWSEQPSMSKLTNSNNEENNTVKKAASMSDESLSDRSEEGRGRKRRRAVHLSDLESLTQDPFLPPDIAAKLTSYSSSALENIIAPSLNTTKSDVLSPVNIKILKKGGVDVDLLNSILSKKKILQKSKGENERLDSGSGGDTKERKGLKLSPSPSARSVADKTGLDKNRPSMVYGQQPPRDYEREINGQHRASERSLLIDRQPQDDRQPRSGDSRQPIASFPRGKSRSHSSSAMGTSSNISSMNLSANSAGSLLSSSSASSTSSTSDAITSSFHTGPPNPLSIGASSGYHSAEDPLSGLSDEARDFQIER